jgi:nitrate/nitrite-specific signal transduction histidine kinase
VVSDNGLGIDPALVESGREGHFGLQGMRERAERIRGKLTILSSVASGTRIMLTVPGVIAFSDEKLGPFSRVRTMIMQLVDRLRSQ